MATRKVKDPINFTQAEFDREQAHRRHCFAKLCAERGGDWPEIFRKKEGMTLRQYKERLDAHRKRKG